MNAYPQPLLDIFHWMLRSSFHATILLALILLVRSAVQKKFRCRAVYWLWVILLLRLVWPFNLPSAVSVFNLLPQTLRSEIALFNPAPEHEQTPAPAIAPLADASSTAQPETTVELQSQNAAEPSTPAEATTPSAPSESPLTLSAALCSVWLAGMTLLGLVVVWNNLRLWRLVKSQRLVTRQHILDLLEDCKIQLGVQTVIGIVETDRIQTPCLFGYLRPRLLLPSDAMRELTGEQLRYIFLHELSHLKRHDILVGWLMAVVQVLHWFNPAVWFAMTRISQDRELACDELALSTLKNNEPKAYGATILTFLERFARSQKLPGMAGIAENPSLAQRRITMIAAFKNTKTALFPALALMAMLIAATFTAAQSQTLPDPERPKDPNTPAAKAKPAILSSDDGEAAGKKSIAGSGHAVLLETPQKSELLAVMIYGSRYGTPAPPKENFRVWLCDKDRKIVKEFEFPYSLFQRGEPKWVRLKTEFADLPQSFYLCVGFNPEQTKGIYVHYDKESSGGSFTGLPESDFKEFPDGDWMIRAMVRPIDASGTPSPAVPAKTGSLQQAIDDAEAGSTLDIPDGTYTDPIRITKSLILKGGKCIFNVTANQPAIFIDTQGKGSVLLEGVTIKWQLASSDQCEYPFARSEERRVG